LCCVVPVMPGACQSCLCSGAVGQPSWSGGIRNRTAGWRGRWRSTTVQCLSNVGPRPGLAGKSETRLCVCLSLKGWTETARKWTGWQWLRNCELREIETAKVKLLALKHDRRLSNNCGRPIICCLKTTPILVTDSVLFVFASTFVLCLLDVNTNIDTSSVVETTISANGHFAPRYSSTVLLCSDRNSVFDDVKGPLILNSIYDAGKTHK
jgi:hypothetical protein